MALECPLSFPSSLPKPKPELVKELRAAALGSELYIVGSDFLLYSPEEGKIEVWKDKTGEPFRNPRYYVLLNHQGWNICFVHQTPEGEFLPLDQRVVERIGGDLAKLTDDPAEIERMLVENEEKVKAKADKERRQRQNDFLAENASAIKKIVDSDGQINHAPAMASPVLYSWNGQRIRSTPQERVATDEEIASTFVQPK